MELEGLGTVFLGAPEMLLDSEVPEARGPWRERVHVYWS